MINKFHIVLVFFLLSNIVSAQLALTSIDVEENLQDVMLEYLFGCDVSITNINYSGNSQAIGEFNYIQNDNLCNNYFGMDRGLLMTTGHIMHALGPNNDGDAGQEWNVEYNDQFLHDYLVDFELITPSINLYDAAVLEFNISSSGFTSIDFELIFGSDEYPEWMSPYYSDAFCFFVTEIDQDIDPFFDLNPKNIMELDNMMNYENNPNILEECDIVNGPISTWMIRPYSYVYQMPGVNECLYLDNQNGDFCDAIGYDGYTMPMNFNFSLFPGATYHVKMVIVDAVSGSWAGLDSGIFIKKSDISTSVELDFNWAEPLYTDLGVAVSFTPSYIDANNLYYWDFNNDGWTDSNEINPVFVFDQPGEYIVTLQVENSCTGLSESISAELIIGPNNVNIIEEVNLDDDIVKDKLTVFPNPVSQFLNVSLENIAQGSQIEIIDLSGQILYDYITHDNTSHIINVNHITPGVYYLRVAHSSNKTYYKKIMIL